MGVMDLIPKYIILLKLNELMPAVNFKLFGKLGLYASWK